ncbi:MAG TPA: DoxX family protein [Nocardioidaceae bacterium]|nr:DoxX family protein [Nocardioidaceae bacterium]
MDVLVLIARLLFCPLFLASAYAHFTQTEGMAAFAKSRGVPSAVLMVRIGGVALTLGGISVLLGLWGDLGALALICFLVPTAVLVHNFWKDSDPQTRMTEQTAFMKDIALAGGALAFFVVYAYAGFALDIVITNPVFDLR